MTRAVRFLPLVGLLLLGCASMNTPYDAPRAGEDGVVAVLSVERTPVEIQYMGDPDDGEIVVYRVRRADGLECDLVWAYVERSGEVDLWFSLQHQQPGRFFSPDAHVTIPVCLRVESIP